MIEKNVQKKVLKAIYLNGGTANTQEISESTGFKIKNVHRACFHLVNRSLLSKKVLQTPAKYKDPPHKLCIFTICKKRINKTKRLISEIE